MKKQVGIWLRVSTEDQAQGESPRHHEERARMYVELKGWEVKEVYHLEAVSGKSVIDHRETKRMIEDVKRGRITGLIFSKLARLARNTRELLEFADIFSDHGADLVSLQESIDTSTPAGRFFYTLIAAMAEWEREEIADRIKASVKVRAKLGKSLGGVPPYGYKWVDQHLELDDDEAPVRKLMFELFAQHKHVMTVAKLLNERGYRTRKGGKFSTTTVGRLLRDPIAKGLRRVNYTQSTGDGKHWELKSEDEWEFQPVPAIVSEELWDTCNAILDEMSTKRTKKRRKPIHLFTRVLKCTCGTTMYMRHRSPKYVCNNCKNKILPDDLEHIFQEQLKSFVFSEEEIKKHITEEQSQIKEKETLLDSHLKSIKEIRSKIQNLLDLYHEGNLEKEAFEEYHAPLYEELKQRETDAAELQGTIDALHVQALSSDQIIQDARDLHSQWSSFSQEDKRTIIEAITESIIVGDEDIEINLNYIPTLTNVDPSELQQKQSKQTPNAPPALSLSFKLVQLLTAGMPLRLLQPSRQGLRVCTGSGGQIPQQDFRAVARPHRPARGSHASTDT